MQGLQPAAPVTRRPFLTAAWRDLAMLNYAVAPDVLAPLVPAGTVLDTWQGTAYVSVVGFRFLGTRLLGVPVPLHRDFEEVNLRFYVRRPMPGGDRRGVVFVREIVPRRAIAAVARLAYNEPYVAWPMRHAVAPSAGGASVRYEWRRGGAWEGLALRTRAPGASLIAGSEAEFITEHYWGYTRQRDAGTLEYRVEHPSWHVWSAERAWFTGPASTAYGPAFGEVLSSPPRSAFVAVGTPIAVHRGRRP